MAGSPPFVGCGWNRLPDELRDRILRHVPFVERFEPATACKLFASSVHRCTRFHPDLPPDGMLPERDCCLVQFALDMMRFGVVDEKLVRVSKKSLKILKGPGHTSLLSRHPDTLADLWAMNEGMYFHMATAPRGKMSAFQYLVDCCRRNKAMNPLVPYGPEDVALLEEWTSPEVRVTARFVVLREVPDGAVFVTMTAVPKCYIVKGSGSPIRDLVRIPAIVDATLLPVGGKYITTDGMMRTGDPVVDKLTAADIFSIEFVYKRAVLAGELYVTHTRIPWRAVEKCWFNRSGKAGRPAPILRPVPLLTQVEKWRPLVADKIAALKRAPKLPGILGMVTIISELGADFKPTNRVTIIGNNGASMAGAILKTRIPDPEEIIDIIYQIAFLNVLSGWKPGHVPSIVTIDSPGTVEIVEKLLAECKITVILKEDLRDDAMLALETERKVAAVRCGYCGRDETSDFKLQQCSRCKHRRYCNREHQRADWKSHKQQCVPSAEP